MDGAFLYARMAGRGLTRERAAHVRRRSPRSEMPQDVNCVDSDKRGSDPGLEPVYGTPVAHAPFARRTFGRVPVASQTPLPGRFRGKGIGVATDRIDGVVAERDRE